jgi:hypothetical protein
MAAEIHEITESNQDVPAWAEHILTDLHAALELLTAQGKLLSKHDDMLEEFRPMLDQFRTPGASMLVNRKLRRMTHDDRNR